MKLRRIEAIIATALSLFFMAVIYGQQIKQWERGYSQDLVKPYIENNLSFNIYQHHLLPLLLFYSLFLIAFLAFNNWIIPQYIETRKYEKALILSLLTIFTLWFGFAFCEWARKTYEEQSFWSYFGDEEDTFPIVIIIIFMFFYTLIKKGIAYGVKHIEALATRIIREAVIACIIIFAAFLFILAFDGKMAFLWLIISAYLLLMYLIELYKVLPFCTKNNYHIFNYLSIRLPLSFLLFIPFGTVFMNVTGLNLYAFFALWLCTNVVSIPIIRYIYDQQRNHNVKLVNLETALGNSTANLSFLRSQINPHFLFNVLNTLYGTALIEEAEITASGIQKLGDIMRFMLHENMQDKILLAREVEYLHNYMDLQKLRTDLSQNITVEHNIQEIKTDDHIAPMLLIPFVENAFKHGISLNERSWIKVSLFIKEGKLFFDVYNSIHQKQVNNPEKNQEGIGLPNVKQRLQQLYPNQHELAIRQTNEEYFIHLTLTL